MYNDIFPCFDNAFLCDLDRVTFDWLEENPGISNKKYRAKNQVLGGDPI